MIKHNLEREKTEDYELMQKISEDKGKKLNPTLWRCPSAEHFPRFVLTVCAFSSVSPVLLRRASDPGQRQCFLRHELYCQL